MVKLWMFMACGGAVQHITPPPVFPSSETRTPSAALALYLRGQLHLNQAEWDEAEAVFQEAMLLDPKSPWLYLALSDVAEGKGELTEAHQFAQQAKEAGGGEAAMVRIEALSTLTEDKP